MISHVNFSLDTEGESTDDHLLDKPLETADAVRNSATMEDVVGVVEPARSGYIRQSKIGGNHTGPLH